MKVIFEGTVNAVHKQMHEWLGYPMVVTQPALHQPALPKTPEELIKEAQADAPAKRGRGRPPKAKPGAVEPEAPKKTGGSQRRGTGADALPPTLEIVEVVEGGLTDEDVTKAASLAAQILMPIGVTAILEQFGVSHVGELSQEQRREFCDLLTLAVGQLKVHRGEE